MEVLARKGVWPDHQAAPPTCAVATHDGWTGHGLLRRGTGCSEIGFIEAIVDGVQEAARIRDEVGPRGRVVAAPCGSTLMVDSRFEAFDGPVASGPLLRLGLMTEGPTRLVRTLDGVHTDTLWRPGGVVVTSPWAQGESRSGALRILGLTVDPDRAACLACENLAGRQEGLDYGVHHDALLSAVMTALWHEVDVHGASTAFFEHGVSLVLRRLTELKRPVATSAPHRPLGAKRFALVAELIESRIDSDLSVRELADAVGRDPSGFSRAFRAETGCTPFAYLTLRRMERAKLLLEAGEPVVRVACAVGYANAGKFAVAFRRYVGLSPTEWRRCLTS